MNAAVKHVISGLLRKKKEISLKGMKIERLHRKKMDSSNNYIIEKKLEKKILQTFGSTIKRIQVRQEFLKPNFKRTESVTRILK